MGDTKERNWRGLNAYGPLKKEMGGDGRMRALRIGPSEGGGLTSSCGCDIAATEEEMVLVIRAVNSHDTAITLAQAVLQEDDDRSIWLPKVIELSKQFLELAGEKVREFPDGKK